MITVEAIALIFAIWLGLFLGAIVYDLKVTGRWSDLSWSRRIWYSIKDVGQPMYYVHMFYNECQRPWCYCHEEER